MLLSCLHSSGSYPFRAVAFDLSLSPSGACRASAARSVRSGVDKGKPAGGGAVSVTVAPAVRGGHVQCGPPLVNSLTRLRGFVSRLRNLAKSCENRRKSDPLPATTGGTPLGGVPTRQEQPPQAAAGRRMAAVGPVRRAASAGDSVGGRTLRYYRRRSVPRDRRAPVAQRIEHLTTDQKVRGSNPFGRALP